jgi:hypothetical protein
MTQVTFEAVERWSNGKRILAVRPSQEGLPRTRGDERLLLAIAAHCVQTVARRSGLERSLERFNELLLNGTRRVK